ncbi:MAG: ABC transporter ATP-binding protein [Candidatus Limnocylindrales bacterium]
MSLGRGMGGAARASGAGPGGGRRGGPFRIPAEPMGTVPPERRGATVRRIARFFRPYGWQVAVVLFAIFVTSLLGLINPYLLKQLIDVALPDKNWLLLNLFVALMIIVPIVSGLIGVGQTYLSNAVGQHVMVDLRDALYTHLQRMPLRFFTETRTGEIQSRLANDVGGVQSVVTDTATSVLSNVTVVISTIIAMILIDWRLTLLSLGTLPFFMYLTYRVGKVRRSVSTETQQSLADMSAITEETLSVSGMLLTKTFGQQAAATERFRVANLRLAALQLKASMVGRWFFMVVGTIFSITPALVYWLAGYLTINNPADAPTIGDIVAFTTLQSRLFFPLGSMFSVQVEVQGALALFDRIFEYLDMDPEIVDAPDAVSPDPAAVRGRVRYQHVSFRYPAGPVPSHRALAAVAEGRLDAAVDDVLRPVATLRPGEAELLGDEATGGEEEAERAAEVLAALRPGSPQPNALSGMGVANTLAAPAGLGEADEALPAGVPAGAPPEPFGLEDIEFEAEPGQLVALVGPSGSGKTTTTYLLPRLYDVDQGSVEIDGTDVRRIKLASLGRLIGVVTQEAYLFHASIRDNLRYARPDATDAELEAAARAAAIHERVTELPAGYDTIVGERGYKLSGGEKQRIAIARVLLKDPRILILDEATSALDTVSERLIQAALERVMEGRTTLAIAHRLSTILAADQILVYERGRIVERGTHRELLAQDGLYARLYHEQFLTAATLAAADARGDAGDGHGAGPREAAGAAAPTSDRAAERSRA